ncbi:MAG: arylesterase [Gammaproteobacteria bacterium]|nr:arylesterase [Gammaproteobacteria bacterium]
MLLLYGCSSDTPPLPKLPEHGTILAFGDSLTAGQGAKKEESYPTVLAQLTKRDVINAGVSGELSGIGVKRLPQLLDRYQPDLLIICHAGNDMLRKKDPNEIKANLREMIQLAQQQSVPVVLLGVPRPGLFLTPASFYTELAEEFNLVYDGDILPDVLSDPSLKSDPVHANNRGYLQMAERIYELLKEHGAL